MGNQAASCSPGELGSYLRFWSKPLDKRCRIQLEDLWIRIESTVHEVSELPTAIDPPDTRAVAIVVQGRIGELGRCDHIILFLHEFFRENSFQFWPDIVFVPKF